MANKNTAKIQIPTWIEQKDNCSNCYSLTNLTVETRKGRYHLCSNECQENFLLKAGLKGYNQIRHHDNRVKPRLQTVGKLQDLTAKELTNLYRFKNQLTKSAMNRQKKGDSLDRILQMIDNRQMKKRGKVQSKMPFTLPDPEIN